MLKLDCGRQQPVEPMWEGEAMLLLQCVKRVASCCYLQLQIARSFVISRHSNSRVIQISHGGSACLLALSGVTYTCQLQH